MTTRSVLRAHSALLDARGAPTLSENARAKKTALQGLRLLEYHLVATCEGHLRGAPLLAPGLYAYLVPAKGRPGRLVQSVRASALVLSARGATLQLARATGDGHITYPYCDADFLIEDLDAFADIVCLAIERHLTRTRARANEYRIAAARAEKIFIALGRPFLPGF